VLLLWAKMEGEGDDELLEGLVGVSIVQSAAPTLASILDEVRLCARAYVCMFVCTCACLSACPRLSTVDQ
jgi:hypothetical protein